MLSQQGQIGEALGSSVQNSPPVFVWRDTLNRDSGLDRIGKFRAVDFEKIRIRRAIEAG